jgi:hypothetical protein
MMCPIILSQEYPDGGGSHPPIPFFPTALPYEPDLPNKLGLYFIIANHKLV